MTMKLTSSRNTLTGNHRFKNYYCLVFETSIFYCIFVPKQEPKSKSLKPHRSTLSEHTGMKWENANFRGRDNTESNAATVTRERQTSVGIVTGNN